MKEAKTSAIYSGKFIGKVWTKIMSHFGLDENASILEKQQLSVFLCSELGMLLISIAATFLYGGVRTPYFYLNNITWTGLIILLFVVYYKRIISLKRALLFHIILYQLVASSKMIYAAMTSSDLDMAEGIVLIDMTLMLCCFIIAYLSCLSYVSVGIVVCSLSSYIASIYLTQSLILLNFLFPFIFMFLLFALFAIAMGNMIQNLSNENFTLKDEKEKLTTLFDLSKQQLRALMSLTSGEGMSHEQIADVMKVVGDKAEKKIRSKVQYLIEQEQIAYDQLSEKFPELAPSEIAICKLILKGKKLQEICVELNKAESNISSQRSHIRSKLGLMPTDNLMLALRRRME
ncbi:MAG: hypothetical protein RRY36_04155, partial [Bacteroidaceae bacterium]